MTSQPTNTFVTTHWEQTTFDETEGAPTLARYVQVDTFKGVVDGEAKMQTVGVHQADGSGTYIGLQRIVGRIGGRSGSVVLQHSGQFAGNTVSGSWSVVPGSGTGELAGLRGEGGFHYEHGMQDIPYTFDYQFD